LFVKKHSTFRKFSRARALSLLSVSLSLDRFLTPALARGYTHTSRPDYQSTGKNKNERFFSDKKNKGKKDGGFERSWHMESTFFGEEEGLFKAKREFPP
jgi:hypothetical protein